MHLCKGLGGSHWRIGQDVHADLPRQQTSPEVNGPRVPEGRCLAGVSLLGALKNARFFDPHKANVGGKTLRHAVCGGGGLAKCPGPPRPRDAHIGRGEIPSTLSAAAHACARQLITEAPKAGRFDPPGRSHPRPAFW